MKTIASHVSKVLLLLSVSTFSLANEQPLTFTPHNGFFGHSKGDGKLRLFFGKQRPFHVDSHGYDLADGSFRLDQTVTFEGKPSRDRSWQIKSIGENRYSATLSDAAGPVTGSTVGRRLLLEYRVKGPLIMHQTLELMPDGKTIDNVGRVTFFGIPIGRLHETIERFEQVGR